MTLIAELGVESAVICVVRVHPREIGLIGQRIDEYGRAIRAGEIAELLAVPLGAIGERFPCGRSVAQRGQVLWPLSSALRLDASAVNQLRTSGRAMKLVALADLNSAFSSVGAGSLGE